MSKYFAYYLFTFNYKYIRLWRSWITQQIPILKNGGSNPLKRAKKLGVASQDATRDLL